MRWQHVLWKRWLDQKIQRKFFITYLILAVIPLCLFGITVYFIAKNTLEKKAQEDAITITNQINYNVDSYLRKIDRMTILPFMDIGIGNYLKADHVKVYPNSLEEFKMENDIRSYFTGLQLLQEGILGSYIVLDSGKVYGSFQNSSIRNEVEINDEPWFQEAVRQQGALVNSGLRHEESQVYYPRNNKKVVSIARYVTRMGTSDEPANEPLGVFVIDIDPDVFNFTAQKPENGFVIITDQRDQLLYFSADADRLNWSNWRANNDYIGQTSKSDYSGWTATYIVSKDYLYRDLAKIRILGVTIIIVLLIFSIFIAGFVARGVAAPILKLSRLMMKVQGGNFDQSIYLLQNDEIGKLAKSFNLMAADLKQFVEKIESKEKQKRIAEIEALRAQINPHFVYNTLSAIRMMALLQNAPEISKVLEIFIQLLKYSTYGNRKWVTIAEELQFITDYVALLEMRYMKKIRLELKLDPQVEELYIIPFIIQPLVENAIFHGMGTTHHQPVIQISFQFIPGHILQIVVKDNGIGMEQDQMDHIMNELESNTQFSGIGLKNIHERIKLEFGMEYGLKITSEIGQGTCIIIQLPMRKEGEI